MNPALTDLDRSALRVVLVDERSLAEAQIRALTKRFDDIVEAAALTNTDDEHDPEGATIAFERAQASALLREARRDRVAVVEALDRLDDPDFGVCDSCRRFIGLERLLAVPTTRRCVACAR